MKVQVDNRVVEMVLVMHQSNKVVYHELDATGRPVSAHSFASDMFSISPGDGVGFLTNGHHYRVGTQVGEHCNLPECTRCRKDEKS
jgi:hypothetical protein